VKLKAITTKLNKRLTILCADMKSYSKQRQAELIDQVFSEIVQRHPSADQALKSKISTLLDDFFTESESTQNREVTILLSDIRGFTALSERYEAIKIVTMLNNYFSEMNKIIMHHGGVIDKYMGDAIMVLFGISENAPDNVNKAIVCAVEMQIAMDKVNKMNQASALPELFMGIGINTGIVSSGYMGSDLHNEYTVIGDEVNLTSRIESHSLRGQVLVSEHTYEKVKDYVEIGSINKVRVKGKSDLVKLYEVVASHWKHSLEVPRREIRNSVRVEINTSFPFQIVKGKEVLAEIYTGQMKDLSYQGGFSIIQQPLEAMTDIMLSLSLSVIGGETRDIYGKIMSSRKIQGGYGCGIEFTALDGESKQSIKNYIDQIIGS